MTSQPTISPAPLDRQGRLLLGVLGAPLAIWALLGFVIALRPSLIGGTEPIWMLAGFEAITATSAVILVVLALGRFREGPAITAGFAALAVAVGAILGSVSSNNVIGTHSLIPFVIAREIVALVIGLAALMLSMRSLAALLKLAVGAALVLPIIAALGLFLLGKLGGVLSSFEDLHPAVSLSAAIVAGFAALTAIAAGGHLVITAFEIGPRAAKADDQDPESQA